MRHCVGLEDSVTALLANDEELSLAVIELDLTISELNATLISAVHDLADVELELDELHERIAELKTNGKQSQMLNTTVSKCSFQFIVFYSFVIDSHFGISSGSIAFHAVLETYTEIPISTTVIFPIVNLNVGNG